MGENAPIITRKIFTSSEIRSLESEIISSGIEIDQLIELASASIARSITKYSPPFSRIVGFVGSGNNGRDCAKTLLTLSLSGKRFAVFALNEKSFSKLVEAPEINSRADFVIFIDKEMEKVASFLESYRPQIVLDGIFGIGFKPPLDERLKKLFSCVNENPYFNVAIDIPTGVAADTGEADEYSFRADITVTFFGLKPAHLIYPGKHFCGDVLVSPLGFESFVSDFETESLIVEEDSIFELLPLREITAHKKSSKVLIVAGSERMPGAAVFAGKAAYAAGAGFVAIASTPKAKTVVISSVPEAVFIPLPEKDGAIEAKAADLILEMSHDFDSCLIGCGLTREPGAMATALRIFREVPLPLVVDGDALFALSSGEVDSAPGLRVLTPHRGEAERLTDEKLASPVKIATQISQKFDAICVYKESLIIVSAGDKSFFFPYGTNLLATAGTGDILSGIIAGMLAQELSPLESSVVATLLLQKTSQLATGIHDGAPLRASEILQYLKLVATGICGG